MGLRARVTLTLIAVLMAVSAIVLAALRTQIERGVEVLEQRESGADFRRLMATLEGRALELKGIMNSWVYWTEMARFVERPTPAFVAQELTPKALKVAGLDWMAVFSSAGRLLASVEVPNAQGQTPAIRLIAANEAIYPAFFAKHRPDRGCGIARSEQQLAFVCFSQVFDSEGNGAGQGLVAVGRWIDPNMVASVQAQTGLAFEFVLPQVVAAEAPLPQLTTTVFGQGEPSVTRDAQSLTLHKSLVTVMGRPGGQLVAHWPRTQLADATNSFWHEQVAIVLALIGGAGVVIIVLVDRLIVRRLKRLRDQLAQVVNHAEFQGEVALAGNDEIAELARMIRRLLEALRTHTQELRNLSQTDSLTGLANRRRFQERLAHLLEQAMRQPKALALILVDVDHFKPYNDHHGHPAGDLALQRVAQCLQHTARRATDLVARLGGEEFALVLDNADPARALQLAEAVRNAVQALQIAHADQPHGQYLTISCGVALSRTGDTLQALYQRADQALYTAKETGRNRVAEFGLG